MDHNLVSKYAHTICMRREVTEQHALKLAQTHYVDGKLPFALKPLSNEPEMGGQKIVGLTF